MKVIKRIKQYFEDKRVRKHLLSEGWIDCGPRLLMRVTTADELPTTVDMGIADAPMTSDSRWVVPMDHSKPVMRVSEIEVPRKREQS